MLIPMQADPASVNQGHYLNVAGRLKPGVTVAAAQAQVTAASEQFRKEYPKYMSPAEGVAVVPMRDSLVGDVRIALLVLSGAVALVLLIACANVASLLLARASGRQRELAIRAAVGATRARVVRQMLTESVVLAGLGGVLGFVLGAWGVRALLAPCRGIFHGSRTRPAILRRFLCSTGAWRRFTVGIALTNRAAVRDFPRATGIRVRTWRRIERVERTLRHRSERQSRLGRLLVVTEVALALVLLVGAALLIRTFAGLQSVNSGIDPRNVLTFQTSLAGGDYTSTAKVENFITQAVRRMETMPGVEAAAKRHRAADRGRRRSALHDCRQAAREGRLQRRRAVAQCFAALFSRSSRFRCCADGCSPKPTPGNSSRVVIINEAMAKRYWKGEDPIGQVITIGKGLGPQFEDPPRQIVGVVGTVRENGLKTADVGVMYIPQSQVPGGLTALANSVIPLVLGGAHGGGSDDAESSVEQELRAVDGRFPFRADGPWSRWSPSHGGAAEFQYAAAEHLCRRCAGAGGYRDLRPDVVLGGAADAGDRHPHGAGRESRQRAAAGDRRRE